MSVNVHIQVCGRLNLTTPCNCCSACRERPRILINGHFRKQTGKCQQAAYLWRANKDESHNCERASWFCSKWPETSWPVAVAACLSNLLHLASTCAFQVTTVIIHSRNLFRSSYVRSSFHTQTPQLTLWATRSSEMMQTTILPGKRVHN